MSVQSEQAKKPETLAVKPHDLTAAEYYALGPQEVCRRLLRGDRNFKSQIDALVSAGKI
jgi:hypothetical protein